MKNDGLLCSFFKNRYAIRESTSIVKIFKNFKEKKSFKPDFGAEGNDNTDAWLTSGFWKMESLVTLCFFFLTGIYGGFLLGVRSVNGLAFYDWENTELVRRIEIQPKHVSLTCLTFSEFVGFLCKAIFCLTRHFFNFFMGVLFINPSFVSSSL